MHGPSYNDPQINKMLVSYCAVVKSLKATSINLSPLPTKMPEDQQRGDKSAKFPSETLVYLQRAPAPQKNKEYVGASQSWLTSGN